MALQVVNNGAPERISDVPCPVEESLLADGQLMYKPALGMSAELGQIYDPTNATLLDRNVFKKDLPPEFIKTKGIAFSESRDVLKSNTSEMCTIFGVGGDARVSLVANAIQGGAFANFLDSQKQYTASSQRCTILYTKTVERSISFQDENVLAHLAPNEAENGVLYVVVGIQYGGYAVMSNKSTRTEIGAEKNKRAGLSGQLTLPELVPATAGDQIMPSNDQVVATGDGIAIGGRSQKTENFAEDQLEAVMFGTFSLKNYFLPTNDEERAAFMKKLPAMVTADNGGIGQPMTLIIRPLVLQRNTGESITPALNFRQIPEVQACHILMEFRDFFNAAQDVKDLYLNATSHKNCLQSDELNKITQLDKDVELKLIELRTDLKALVAEVRRGEGDPSLLDIFCEKITAATANIMVRYTDCGSSREKIIFLQECEMRKIMYVGGFDHSLVNLASGGDQKTYVFYFSANGKEVAENRSLFFEKHQEEKEHSKFYAVDLDLHHPNCNISGTCVQVLKGRHVAVSDLLAWEEKMRVISLAKASKDKHAIPFAYRPKGLIPFSVRCPGRQCNPDRICEWACPFCLTRFDFCAADSSAYCKCRCIPVKYLEYRCNSGKHGSAFEKHDETVLPKLIKKIHQRDVVNILVVGEVGVGKTTFVNNFGPIIQYGSLEEARSGGWSPPEAHTTTDKATVYTIKIDHLVGSSYLSPITVRLIDTPGIGSEADVEASGKRLQNSVATLSKFNEYHAILVMVNKVDENGAEKMERALTQVLLCVPREAVGNIMFGSTSSGVFPSSSRQVLNRLMAKLTQDQLQLDERNTLCFSKGSSLEIIRMMRHVRDNLVPQDTKLVRNMLLSRELIMECRKLVPDCKADREKDKMWKEFQKCAGFCAKFLQGHGMIAALDPLASQADGNGNLVIQSTSGATSFKKGGPEDMDQLVRLLENAEAQRFMEVAKMKPTVLDVEGKIIFPEVLVQLDSVNENMLFL